MTYAQRLRKLANSTGLDAFGDEIRAIADEMDAQPADVTDSMIREAFLTNGFAIKDGRSDLKPYVYAAARAILALRPERVPMTDGIRPEDFTVDVVVKPMGGFAPVNTQGVRVTHKPTGISVTCDADRSQHTNRQQAFEKLSAILAQQPATGEPVKSFAELHEKHRAGIDAERAKLDATSVPEFSRIAKRKMADLQEQGFTITGYAIQRGTQRGFITNGGFVGWWRSDEAPSVPKDDQIAALVNKVRDIARMFHDHQSLRERIAIELVPAIKASQEVKSNAERWRYAIADGGNQSMNFIDIFDDWDGDGSFVEAFDKARLADKKEGSAA